MPQRKCRVCKKQMYVKPSHLSRGWGKFCSKKCQSVQQKTGKFIQCDTCGTEVYRSPKELKKSGSQKYFCSKRCHCVWENVHHRTREHHYNWQGGRATYRKFALRYTEGHYCRRCNINDERVLVIHHKDRNRNNNALNNLLILCINCHYIEHQYNGKAST